MFGSCSLRRAATGGFTIERFATCMGRETAVGAVRASVGMATNDEDVRRAIEVVRGFADGE